MKLLLDMYKGVSKDQRDKVQLMAAEKKARADVEDLRQQMKKMQVSLKSIAYYYINKCGYLSLAVLIHKFKKSDKNYICLDVLHSYHCVLLLIIISKS
jgi:hypothetical protein